MEQGLAEQRQFRGQDEPGLSRNTRELQDDLADLKLADRRVLIGADQVGAAAAEFLLVEALPLPSDLDGLAGSLVRPAFADREEKLQEPLLHAGRDPRHHAQL